MIRDLRNDHTFLIILRLGELDGHFYAMHIGVLEGLLGTFGGASRKCDFKNTLAGAAN